MVSDRSGSEAVIQGVLAERALGPIHDGEDVIKVEINPCSVVKGMPAAQMRDPSRMRSGHSVRAPKTCDREPPRVAHSSETLCAAAAEPSNDEEQQECGQSKPQKSHGAVTLAENARVFHSAPDRLEGLEVSRKPAR